MVVSRSGVVWASVIFSVGVSGVDLGWGVPAVVRFSFAVFVGISGVDLGWV